MVEGMQVVGVKGEGAVVLVLQRNKSRRNGRASDAKQQATRNSEEHGRSEETGNPGRRRITTV